MFRSEGSFFVYEPPMPSPEMVVTQDGTRVWPFDRHRMSDPESIRARMAHDLQEYTIGLRTAATVGAWLAILGWPGELIAKHATEELWKEQA